MLKPQDIMLLLKLAVHPNSEWTYPSLAHDLAMSVSEVHTGLKRAERSGLFSRELRRPLGGNWRSLFCTGCATPSLPRSGASPGDAHRRQPPVFLEEFPFSPEENYVWPHPDGQQRGMSLSPLSNRSPGGHQRPAALHRPGPGGCPAPGRKREMDFARRELKKLLKENA